LAGTDNEEQRSEQNMRNDGQAETAFEEGSGNVFADLGLDDGDELFARAKIGFHVYQILKAKKLTQRQIASLLCIKQPEVSHLMNGHFSRFTTDKLLDFLKRLELKVTIRIGPHNPGEPYQEVGFDRLSW
jgi:predicted XRE-type DNA-binding protein